MMETMEQYMSKTRENYGSGVTRPTINQDTPFELKGQFLKELRDNTFSGSEHEDANDTSKSSLTAAEVILFYNGLDVPTRQILDSNGAIPSKSVADAKIAIHEMVEYSQKWHNGTSSRTRSTETSDGLAAIQAQLNNLGREIKKVNEKVSPNMCQTKSTEPRNESNVKIKFSKELLTELQNNTFGGRCEKDVIGHISKVLEILDLVKIAGVDHFQLCMKSFPLSLSKGAKEWWMNEGNGNISTWEELVKNFFKKFYPLSCAINYDKMCDNDEEGRDLLEFIPWRNSKFKDHKKVDETTKRALLYTWIEIRKVEGLLNDEVLSDEDWEEQEYENPPKYSTIMKITGTLTNRVVWI
ncbi:hypothetical protein Tco_0805580 [Tanacetum coccineum]